MKLKSGIMEIVAHSLKKPAGKIHGTALARDLIAMIAFLAGQISGSSGEPIGIFLFILVTKVSGKCNNRKIIASLSCQAHFFRFQTDLTLTFTW